MATVLNLLSANREAFVDAVRRASFLLDNLPEEEKIEALNEGRAILHEKSPYRSHPADCVLWVKTGHVAANDYNPNNVASPEMRLLELSIREDGYTMPAVVVRRDEGFEVVDGYHRYRVANEKLGKHLHGRMPVSVLDKPYEARMASTIRHNRARGVHAVTPMSDIVAHLAKEGWQDEEIGKHLGMCQDEVLRLKQCSGVVDAFRDTEFSAAWE